MAEIKKVWSNMNHVAFWICLATSIFLLVLSMLLPPKGVIDPSIIGATGEMFAFATLATVINGIEHGRKITMQKGDTHISIGRNKKKQDENAENEYEHGGEYENEVLGNRDN